MTAPASGQAVLHRLASRAQFQAVMAAGSCARTPHFVLHRMVLNGGATPQASSANPPSGPDSLPLQQGPQALFVVPKPLAAGPWLGPLVPKRWAKRSVTRHLLRRQIYAVGADYAAQLPQHMAFVVRLRAEFDRKHFVSASSEALRQAVRTELQQLFAYAVRKLAAPAPGEQP